MAIEHDFFQRDFVSVEKEFISCFNRLTGNQEDYICVGIDGCKGGWVAVSITGNSYELAIVKNIEEAFSMFNHSDSIIVDMPIGLPESIKDVRPDSAARLIIKGKSSSIFNTPCRQAAYASNYSEANEIKVKGGRQIMYQLIRRYNEEYDLRVFELHPGADLVFEKFY